MLIELGQPATADSIIERGRIALGTARDLQYETAQLRAAMGEWEPSASAWRRALANDAAACDRRRRTALAPAPPEVRPALRNISCAAPPERGSRRALAELEITWGQPQAALGSASRAAGRHRVGDGVGGVRRPRDVRGAVALARDALAAAVRVRRTPALALEAAAAALRCGVARRRADASRR